MSLEEPIKEQSEESKEKEKLKHKKITRGIIISICILLVFYLGMTKYFTTHFYFGSEINSVSVSGKTVDEAKIVMESSLKDYTLNLKERGGKTEQIKAGDVDLQYNTEDEFKKFKDSQNPFRWVLACFSGKDSRMTVGFSYDENLLQERIDKLSCFDSSNIIEPKNPSFKYADNNYVIVDEVPGNKVDRDTLHSHVSDAILSGKTEIDLESLNCYVKPEYNSKSEKVIEARDALNKYVSSKITYTFEDKVETVDASIINKWLSVDDNFEVTVNKKKVRDYIDVLAKSYNTVGRTRSFVTTSGKTINVGGGDYGWSINKPKETQSLIAAVTAGQTITKEPAYKQTAFSRTGNDIGNTYVEISLSGQHIWFYKNGSLVVEGNVVTGNVSRGHSTPPGVYRLKYKQKNAILRGPGYAAPVTYWMPFNGGIGIHDANWRSVFGGRIYRTSGSHGCVNAPYSVAKAIFYNIKADTPIVCY